MEDKSKKTTFMEHAYDTVRPLLISPEQFRPFCDRPQGVHFPDKYRDKAIANGEALLGKEYHLITASEFLMFHRCGDREHFQKCYFERRNDLLTLERNR